VAGWYSYLTEAFTQQTKLSRLIFSPQQNLQDAKERMRRFCETQTSRKFRCRYNANTQSVWVDRAVTQK
jgi:hypothetical protein